MNNLPKLFCILAVAALRWPHAATAQSLVNEPTTAPPHVWRNVAMGGGGFVTGIVFHPNAKNLIYARTDVGDAYRWDEAGENWVRINDDQHQYGYISRVTGDPRIYGRVYFATGGRGVIYGEINGVPALGKN